MRRDRLSEADSPRSSRKSSRLTANPYATRSPRTPQIATEQDVEWTTESDEDSDSTQTKKSSRASTPALKRRRRKAQQDTDMQPLPPSRPRASEGSLGWDIWRDVRRAPRALYPFLKWPLFLYLLVMITAWSFSVCLRAVTRIVTPILEPVCSIPGATSMVPFCAPATLKEVQSVDLAKAISSQEHLQEVMTPAGQNLGLAYGIVAYGSSVRDLRNRVSASDLLRKDDLESQLHMLIDRTDEAAKGISRFAARLGKSVDSVITFDRLMVKKLQAIEDSQSHPPSLPQNVLHALNPLSAFSSPVPSEEKAKKDLLWTATQIAEQLEPVTVDAFQLYDLFQKIDANLDRIQELSFGELGDLPRMDILASLWAQLARADDYEQHKSKAKLLGDLMMFYKSAREGIEKAIVGLNIVDAEVKEFRDDYAKPGLVFKEYSLELLVSMLSNSAKRLDVGRRRMDGTKPEQLPGG